MTKPTEDGLKILQDAKEWRIGAMGINWEISPSIHAESKVQIPIRLHFAYFKFFMIDIV
ncbi:MAG: hypothetical protein ACYCSA_05990 [Thermoplasmataceae archaeon]